MRILAFKNKGNEGQSYFMTKLALSLSLALVLVAHSYADDDETFDDLPKIDPVAIRSVIGSLEQGDLISLIDEDGDLAKFTSSPGEGGLHTVVF